jgi:hypothetical protein
VTRPRAEQRSFAAVGAAFPQTSGDCGTDMFSTCASVWSHSYRRRRSSYPANRALGCRRRPVANTGQSVLSR